MLSHASTALGDVESAVAVRVDGAGAVRQPPWGGFARFALEQESAAVHVAHAAARERGSPAAGDDADVPGRERLLVVTPAQAPRPRSVRAVSDRARFALSDT